MLMLGVPVSEQVFPGSALRQFSCLYCPGSCPQEPPAPCALVHLHLGTRQGHGRAVFSSFTRTISLMVRFLRDRDHFWRSCKLRRNSFRQRDQNSLAKCCTRLQRLRAYMSAGSKVPGGASSTLDFMVNRWLGVSGAGESGSASYFTHQCPKGLVVELASIAC